MKRLLFMFGCAMILAGIAGYGYCQTTPYSQNVDMQATIESLNSLTLSITKVQGTTVTPNQGAVDFGMLTYDSTYRIFRANCYYFVDVGVDSNAASWTLTHTINYNVVRQGGTETLNDNINVTFVKQISDTNSTTLAKLSLTKSNGIFYTKEQISPSREPGWLRIYYGIASGSGDGDGVAVIGTEKPPGLYSGQIKITLTAI